jgi:hypothetical protein
LSFDLGLIACSLAGVGVHAAWVNRRRRDPQPGPADALARIWSADAYPMLVLATLPVLLSLTVAAPLWQIAPVLAQTVTYPWQLLLLAGPALAWLAGLGASHGLATLNAALAAESAGRIEAPALAGAIALVLLGSYGQINPPAIPAPPHQRPLAVFGEEQIVLLDASISGAPRANGQVQVRAQWQALKPVAEDYTVFLHVVGPDGTVWAQQDTMPQGNKMPTSRWQPGAVVEDEYRVTLPPTAPIDAEYSYVIGWYQYQTGRRLANGAGDKVVLHD